MNAIPFLTSEQRELVAIHGDTPLVDTRVIAENIGVQHESFYKLVKEHQPIIEEAFGQVRFEIGDGVPLPQGGRTPSQRFALLTEDQTTFAITLTRNTVQVVQFKAALVKAFAEAKRQLTGGNIKALSRIEILELALEAEKKAERLELQMQEAKPKLDFFDCAMNSENGLLVRDAAKLLNADVPGGIGERRLFKWMRANGWIMAGNRPYQTKVDAGLMILTERPIPTNSGTIIQITPRVTQKGLASLHRALTENRAA